MSRPVHPTLIVTRHPGAVEWLQSKGYEGDMTYHLDPAMLEGRERVIGVLPIHLAVLAHQMGVQPLLIQFEGSPPRGVEYGAAEMEAAGAYLAALCLQWRMTGGEWQLANTGIPDASAGDMQEFRIGLVRVY